MNAEKKVKLNRWIEDTASELYKELCKIKGDFHKAIDSEDFTEARRIFFLCKVRGREMQELFDFTAATLGIEATAKLESIVPPESFSVN
jgi:hypothetical protein